MKVILKASKNIGQKIYCPEQVFSELEKEKNQPFRDIQIILENETAYLENKLKPKDPIVAFVTTKTIGWRHLTKQVSKVALLMLTKVLTKSVHQNQYQMKPLLSYRDLLLIVLMKKGH